MSTWIKPDADMQVARLLPSNATKLERDLERTGAAFLSALRVDLRTLWHADTCPERFLPALAWALSVDDWNEEWSTAQKRAAIKASPRVSERTGTTWAVRQVLAQHGHADAVVFERYGGGVRYDGLTQTRDATRLRGGSSMWATYKVILKRPVTRDMAQVMQHSLHRVKRNCVHLIEFDFTAAAYRHNRVLKRDGVVTYGAVE